MSRERVSEETELSYEPPSNTQFSVFLDNRVGKLLELLHVFDGQALHLAGMCVNDSADHAVVRLLTSRGELARRLLTRGNMAFSEGPVIVAELSKNQTLAKLCSSLLAAELNINYAFPLIVQPHGLPTVALRCDDMTMATEILLRKRFTLLGENDLGENATNSDAGAGEI